MGYVVPEYGCGATYDFREMEAMAHALQQDGYEGGALLQAFEQEFAAFCGVKHAIGTVSGTMALHMAAHVLRLGLGDEVICTPQTFQATMLPFIARKVRVRCADIEAETLCIDPATIEPLIGPQTKAIYVMHYGGLPCDMDPIMEIAGSHGLPVVEDAAHAAGTTYKGRRIGGIGTVTCFSFGSLKNMTTLGRGGMITTNDDTLAEGLRAIRGRGLWRRTTPKPDCGASARRHCESRDSSMHDYAEIDGAGMNIPMTGAEAAVGRVQLAKLDQMNQIRRDLAARYAAGLCQTEGLRVQPVTPERHSVYHLFPFFLNEKESGVNREDLIKGLEERGVRINNRFYPCHLADYFRPGTYKLGECPVCERVWFQEQVNLPISPLHTPAQIDYVVQQVADLAKQLRR